MKKIIAVLLAILTVIGASAFTVSTSAELKTGEKVYEAATDEVIEKYLGETSDLINEIVNSKTEVTPTGTVYYISANGSDTNDGLTPETAWRSVSKISDGKILKEGDAVLFERGGQYRYTDPIALAKGVTYSAYGQGAKPMLIGSVDATSKGSWAETDVENVYVYTKAITRDVGVIVFNMGEANGIKMMSLLDNGTVSNGYETFKSGGHLIDGPEDLKNDLEFWHDPYSNNVYLMSTKGAPSDRFVSIELVDHGHAMSGSGVDVTVDNLAFFGFGSHGIGLGYGKNLRIQYCTFNFIGGSTQGDAKQTTTRYGNAVEIYGSADGYYIDHCYATNVYDCCWTIQCGDGGHVFKNVEFSNNVAMYSNSGPEIWLGDSQGSGRENKMENVRVHHNYTLFSGYGWSHQRHNKDGNLLYGGTVETDVEFINMSFDNNVGICPSYWLYYARYTSPEHGYNLNNNVYIQHNTSGFGGVSKEPIMGEGGIGFRDLYTEETIKHYTELGLEPGSKFWYVTDDFVVPKYAPDVMTFNDITEEHWAYTNVKTAVMKSWFKGTSEDNFSPDMGMTRGMLVTVLARLASVDTATNEIPYNDVAKNAWFYPTVKWAYNLGVVGGGDKFRPDDKITREELADMLYKYTLKQYKTKAYDGSGLDFKDATDVSAEYAPGVAFATANGIITGYPDGTVKPQNGATRAEVATMIKRFADVYFDLEADYSNITTKTDSQVFMATDIVKAVPNAPSIINADTNPAIHYVAGTTNASGKQLSIFERFLKVNFADYPYIKLRYKTDINAEQIGVGAAKGGRDSMIYIDIEPGKSNSVVFSYYDIIKPDGSVDLTQANGSLYIKPWASFGEWGTNEKSYFDIEYIACFPTKGEAEKFQSDFEANSVLITFMNDNSVYSTVSAKRGDKFTSTLVPAIEKKAHKFVGWSIEDGTVLTEDITVEAQFEKILGEPVALFTPDNATAKGDGGLAVETKTEDGITFFHFTVPTDTSSRDGTRANVNLSAADYDVSINKVMKVGYRESIASADHVEMNFMLSGNRRLWNYYVKYGAEGKWNEAVIDLSKVNYSGGENIRSGLSAEEIFKTYVNGNMSPMFKPYQNNGLSMVTTDYFDVAYVAYFNSVEDANAFNGFAAIKK